VALILAQSIANSWKLADAVVLNFCGRTDDCWIS
jgi:hypothetical protein